MALHPHRPDSIAATTRLIAPSTLRHLIYRIIGGAYKGELDYIQGWELQVMANLVPQVWNDHSDPVGHRVIGQDLVLFERSYCLNCGSIRWHWDDISNPLEAYCKECVQYTNRHELLKKGSTRSGLVSNFSNWPREYQLECIEFLCDLTLRRAAL